jgi:hypothetical protein
MESVGRVSVYRSLHAKIFELIGNHALARNARKFGLPRHGSEIGERITRLRRLGTLAQAGEFSHFFVAE